MPMTIGMMPLEAPKQAILEAFDVQACVGLELLDMLEFQGIRATYCKAVFAAPADLSTLMAYSTYAARIAKIGGRMARFGVDLQRWQVEVVFTPTWFDKLTNTVGVSV